MLIKTKQKLLLIAVIVFSVAACQPHKSDIEGAKATVFAYFEYYSTKPFSPHGFNSKVLYKDYWGPPGVEGTRIICIDRHIELLEAEKYLGDQSLYKNRQEELIRIAVRVKERFIIEDERVTKANVDKEIIFYLSKYGSSTGSYLILNHSPLDYDLYFEDSMRDFLKDHTDWPLREELISAGMQGLR